MQNTYTQIGGVVEQLIYWQQLALNIHEDISRDYEPPVVTHQTH